LIGNDIALPVTMRTNCVLISVVVLTAELSASVVASSAADKAAPAGQPVHVQMQNVALHVDDETVLDIARLRGMLISTRAGQPPVFDDKNSFIVRIDSAEIAVTTANLARLMNEYVFSDKDAPLRNVQVTLAGDRLRIKGSLRKGISVPFTMVAAAAVDGGELRLHPMSIKTAGIPVKRLMSLFRVELEKLIALKRASAVRVDGDDLLVNPGRLLPPPRIEGRLQAVRLEQDRIVQVFGPGQAPALKPPDPHAPNYMYYRGGSLRFGKLTMTDADMQLIDRSPADAFDFFQDRYNMQLVAGYSKNTPEHGLKVYMPDYHRLTERR
jgi:hypothetical protein